MKLTRPLVVLDLETTGTWIQKDRIIEIAMIRCPPSGERETYHRRVNPGMPIPPVVAAMTGIDDAVVKEAPRFREIAREVAGFIGDADLGGFNIQRFDLPLLQREMRDAGVDFDWCGRTVYDAQKIFHIHERRDLGAAYAFYCRKDLSDAHSALADTRATLEVLEAQVTRYGEGREEIEALKEFDYARRPEFLDPERRFRWWNGRLYMMFGKYNGKLPLTEVAKIDRPYLEWILSRDFSPAVKEVVRAALDGRVPGSPPEETAPGNM